MKNRYLYIFLSCIEKKYFPEKEGTNRPMSQRDFQLLIDLVEEKSNVKISLSTFKRLWKREHDYRPHLHTLNSLAGLLDHENWQEFKSSLDEHEDPHRKLPMPYTKSRPLRWALPIIVLVVICGIAIFFYGSMDSNKMDIPDTLKFEVDKTVTSGVPNTVVFNYDLKAAVADSFFIQRSWNSTTKTPVDPSKNYLTEVYYFPGFHWAKLMANDSIIGRRRIHVKTDGWLATAKYNRLDHIPKYLVHDTLSQNGIMRISQKNWETSGLDRTKEIVLSYYNIMEYKDMDSDALRADVRVKIERSETVCPFMELTIIDEQDASWIPLIQKGCEGNLALKVGENQISGKDNDLSGFGTDVGQWQNLAMEVRNGKATIFLNGHLIYEMETNTGRGKIMGLILNFSGMGAIDYLRLESLDSGEIFVEEF